LQGKKVPIYKPGNQIREWLYVEDHCRGIEAVLEKGKTGETYFIGPDNKELSNLDVIRKLLELMGLGEDMIEFAPDRPGHDQKYALDHSKITKQLGWSPKFNLDESLRKTVDWYKQNQPWWKKLKKV
jgi:dTDP-glucose 4,6-dehydratase